MFHRYGREVLKEKNHFLEKKNHLPRAVRMGKSNKAGKTLAHTKDHTLAAFVRKSEGCDTTHQPVRDFCHC
jgi:hypothetical protein